MPSTVERNPLAGIRGRKLQASATHRAALAGVLGETDGLMADIPGMRFFFWLGQAAREMREEHDVKPEVIAAKADVSKEKVSRFEIGRNRPQDLELMLAAYAECIDLDDPREIVVRGVRKWFEHGQAPALDDLIDPLSTEPGPLGSDVADDPPSARAAAPRRRRRAARKPSA